MQPQRLKCMALIGKKKESFMIRDNSYHCLSSFEKTLSSSFAW